MGSSPLGLPFLACSLPNPSILTIFLFLSFSTGSSEVVRSASGLLETSQCWRQWEGDSKDEGTRNVRRDHRHKMPRTPDVIVHPPSVASMIHRWQPADSPRESNQRQMVGLCTLRWAFPAPLYLLGKGPSQVLTSLQKYTMDIDVLRGPSTAAETLALVC